MRLGRPRPGLAGLPIPLGFYSLWMVCWFAFACQQQFLMTRVSPATALKMAAVVLLLGGVCCTAWLYGCFVVLHQLFPGPAARRARRGARHAALVFVAMLIAGWGAFQLTGDTVLFVVLRSLQGLVAFPLAGLVWVWMLVGGGRQADPSGGARDTLAAGYLGLCTVAFILGLVRSRLGALSPAVPATLDILAEGVYVIGTVSWVELWWKRHAGTRPDAPRAASADPPRQAVP